jgi:hypothetical protein
MLRASLMTPADRKRLIAILGMLGSDQPGERAAAGLKAEELRKKLDLSWEQIIGEKSDEKPRSGGRRTDWEDKIEECAKHMDMLSEWEQGFVENMMMWDGVPTPRQKAVIDRILRTIQKGPQRKWGQ